MDSLESHSLTKNQLFLTIEEHVITPTHLRKFWVGKTIDALRPHEVYVFGANPSFYNGAGGALSAMQFGAKNKSGRGIVGQTYGIITKNLVPNFHEKSTGITYTKTGYRSVSMSQIHDNIAELYSVARRHAHLDFLVSFQIEQSPRGKYIKSLNGYTALEIAKLFLENHQYGIPVNIVFHHSYAQIIRELHLEEACTPQENAVNHYVVNDPSRFDLKFHNGSDIMSCYNPKSNNANAQGSLF